MAEEIAVGAWVVSASATPEGGLAIAVTLDGEPYATLVVPPSGLPQGEEARRAGKLGRDMDF